jgi:outer membrane autotransporter protein
VGLRLGASYALHDIDTSRGAVFPGFAESLDASYDASTRQVFGELAYRFDAAGAAIEPFAGLAYVDLNTDGFTETGGAAALTGEGEGMSTTFTSLGLRLSAPFTIQNIKASVRATIGWLHSFGDIAPAAQLAFSDGADFQIAGVPIARDAALLDAGLAFAVTDRLTVGLAYSGRIGDDVVDQGLRADLALRF